MIWVPRGSAALRGTHIRVFSGLTYICCFNVSNKKEHVRFSRGRGQLTIVLNEPDVLLNVFGHKKPRRDGCSRGGRVFSNLHLLYHPWWAVPSLPPPGSSVHWRTSLGLETAAQQPGAPRGAGSADADGPAQERSQRLLPAQIFPRKRDRKGTCVRIRVNPTATCTESQGLASPLTGSLTGSEGDIADSFGKQHAASVLQKVTDRTVITELVRQVVPPLQTSQNP